MSAAYPLLLRDKVAQKMLQTKDDVKQKGMPKKKLVSRKRVSIAAEFSANHHPGESCLISQFLVP